MDDLKSVEGSTSWQEQKVLLSTFLVKVDVQVTGFVCVITGFSFETVSEYDIESTCQRAGKPIIKRDVDWRCPQLMCSERAVGYCNLT